MEEPLIEVSVPIQANVNPLSELAGNLISGNSGKQDEVILQDVLDLEDPNPSSFQYEDEQMPRRRIIFRRGLKQPLTMSCCRNTHRSGSRPACGNAAGKEIHSILRPGARSR